MKRELYEKQVKEALKYYEMAVLIDPYLRHRANLDPELSDILKLNN